MGAIIIIGAIIYVIYKVAEEISWNNCKAHDVDYSRMIRENHLHTPTEQKKLYKSGYYNKKSNIR